jgi:hypothetical protein
MTLNDINILIEKEVRCEEAILTYLNETKICRSHEIQSHLKGKYPPITIKRKLKSLEKFKQILRMSYPAYKLYVPACEDKKAVFYMPQSRATELKHYNAVIKSLDSDDVAIKKKALIELDSLKTIALVPDQLFRLSKFFKTESIDLCFICMRILNTHMDKNQYPSHKEEFHENLLEAFKRFYGKIPQDYENFNEYLLVFLALLEDNIVLETLKKEVLESKNDDKVYQKFANFRISRLIESNKDNLFTYTLTLSDDKSKLMFRIRENAKNHVEFYNGNYEYIDKGLRDWK